MHQSLILKAFDTIDALINGFQITWSFIIRLIEMSRSKWLVQIIKMTGAHHVFI